MPGVDTTICTERHHAGCACHEARRDAEVATTRAELTEMRQQWWEQQQISDRRLERINELCGESGRWRRMVEHLRDRLARTQRQANEYHHQYEAAVRFYVPKIAAGQMERHDLRAERDRLRERIAELEEGYRLAEKHVQDAWKAAGDQHREMIEAQADRDRLAGELAEANAKIIEQMELVARFGAERDAAADRVGQLADYSIENVRLAAELAECQRMLCDLTVGGSEFVNNPRNCFNWIKRHISESTRLTVKATIERKEAERQLADADKAIHTMHELNADAQAEWNADKKQLATERAYTLDLTRLLEGLTPGGPEYEGNPHACAAYARGTMEQLAQAKADLSDMHAQWGSDVEEAGQLRGELAQARETIAAQSVVIDNHMDKDAAALRLVMQAMVRHHSELVATENERLRLIDKFLQSESELAQERARVAELETELSNWQETARQYAENTGYWRTKAEGHAALADTQEGGELAGKSMPFPTGEEGGWL